MLSSFFFQIHSLFFFFFEDFSSSFFFVFFSSDFTLSLRSLQQSPFLFIYLAGLLAAKREKFKKKKRKGIREAPFFFFFTSSVCLFLFLFSFSVCVISPNIHRIHAFYFFMYGFTIKKTPLFLFFPLIIAVCI